MNILMLLTCSDNNHKHTPQLSHALTGYKACAYKMIILVNGFYSYFSSIYIASHCVCLDGATPISSFLFSLEMIPFVLFSCSAVELATAAFRD
jgi:hypothetical protein